MKGYTLHIPARGLPNDEFTIKVWCELDEVEMMIRALDKVKRKSITLTVNSQKEINL